jgi:hypothetical protein
MKLSSLHINKGFKWTFPMRIVKRLFTAYTVSCVPTTIPGQTKANSRSKGKDERQINFLPTPICS